VSTAITESSSVLFHAPRNFSAKETIGPGAERTTSSAIATTGASRTVSTIAAA
jgi:hypothetical protein